MKKEGSPRPPRTTDGPTAFKLLIDEAKSQSYAKTPKLEHISPLEVFAHWIPGAPQADAEDMVKSFRAKMGSHVGVLKRASSVSATKTRTKKPESGDGDAFLASLFEWSFEKQRCAIRGSLTGNLFTFSLWLSDDGTARAVWTADAPTKFSDLRHSEKTERRCLNVFSLFSTANLVQSAGFGMFQACVSCTSASVYRSMTALSAFASALPTAGCVDERMEQDEEVCIRRTTAAAFDCLSRQMLRDIG